MANAIVSPALEQGDSPHSPAPGFPETPTICARCSKPCVPGHHLCSDCIERARMARETSVNRVSLAGEVRVP